MQSPEWPAFSVGAAVVAVVLAAGASSDAKREAAQSQTPSGTFFGASADGRAWLVFVDPARGWGSLYIPPQAHELCGLTNDSGRVVLQWAPGYRHMQYGFEGRRIASDLVGEMIGTPGAREDNPVNDSARLRRVSDPPSEKDVGRSGYYSNITPRGGEYGGMEFLFLDVPQQPVALVTFYEGSAGPPWAAQDLAARGDTLRFRIHREGRDDTFEVVFQNRTALLWSTTLGLPRQRLNKRATVAELAHLTWKPGCPDSLRVN